MQFLNCRFSKTLTNEGIKLFTTPPVFPFLVEFGTGGAKRRVRAVLIITGRSACLLFSPFAIKCAGYVDMEEITQLRQLQPEIPIFVNLQLRIEAAPLQKH